MAFCKTYPREVEGTSYPKWEEVRLSDQEERLLDETARRENIYLLRQCIADAKNMLEDENLRDYQGHVLLLGTSLFKKRASHAVHWKEKRCKEKFDSIFTFPMLAEKAKRKNVQTSEKAENGEEVKTNTGKKKVARTKK